jgi:hypothetical protein
MVGSRRAIDCLPFCLNLIALKSWGYLKVYRPSRVKFRSSFVKSLGKAVRRDCESRID